MSGLVYCKNRLRIIDRKTQKRKEVELKDFRKLLRIVKKKKKKTGINF